MDVRLTSCDLNRGTVPIRGSAGLFRPHRLALEAGAGGIRILKEGKGLEHSAQRRRTRQELKGGGIEGQPPSPGMEPWMSDQGRHRDAVAPCSWSEQQATQNRKAMERLTKASPARPVAARIERDWITGSFSTVKT